MSDRSVEFDDLLFASGWRAGYKAGKESGLLESTHGGEIAMLRERLLRSENATPIDKEATDD